MTFEIQGSSTTIYPGKYSARGSFKTDLIDFNVDDLNLLLARWLKYSKTPERGKGFTSPNLLTINFLKL